MSKPYKTQDLEDCVKIAKSRGYKVYTAESTNKYITYIFIEHRNGSIGYVQSHFGGIQFSTQHKSTNGYGDGSGYGSLIRGQDFNNPEDLDIVFITYPYWKNCSSGAIYKYTSMQDYIDKGLGILTYYEL